MLAEFHKIKEILVCPRTGDRLTQIGETIRPVHAGSSAGKIRYRLIGGKPALVDFDNSLLDEKELVARNGKPDVIRGQGSLKRWVKKNLFVPEANRLACRHSEAFCKKLKWQNKEPLLLVIGGGTKGMGTDIFYSDPDIQVVGIDTYVSEWTQFIADAHRIPIAAGSIDGVWIQYVLEHVLDPWQVVSEIHRVLKSDGLIYSEVPFLQQVHEGPYDFFRFTCSGHRWLYRRFSEIDSGIAMGSGVQFLWSIEHAVRGLLRSIAAGKIAKLLLFWIQFFEKLIPSRYVLDSASSTYFFGRKAETELKEKEIIQFYRGALHLE